MFIPQYVFLSCTWSRQLYRRKCAYFVIAPVLRDTTWQGYSVEHWIFASISLFYFSSVIIKLMFHIHYIYQQRYVLYIRSGSLNP